MENRFHLYLSRGWWKVFRPSFPKWCIGPTRFGIVVYTPWVAVVWYCGFWWRYGVVGMIRAGRWPVGPFYSVY